MQKLKQIRRLSLISTLIFTISCGSSYSELNQEKTKSNYRNFDDALKLIDDNLRDIKIGIIPVDLIATFEYRLAKSIDLSVTDVVLDKDYLLRFKQQLDTALSNPQIDGNSRKKLKVFETELLKFETDRFHTNTKLRQSDFAADGKFFVHGLVYENILSRNARPFTFLNAIEKINFEDPKAVPQIVEKLETEHLKGLPSIKTYGDQHVFVTGEFYYSMPIILGNLGLNNWATREMKDSYELSDSYHDSVFDVPSDASLKKEAPRKATIYSIGEGHSGLVPFLLSQGHNAIGLDLVYGASIPKDVAGYEYMKAYEAKYAKNLIQGDAADLPTSFKSGKADFVLFHAVLNYLSEDDAAKALAHAFRLLKPGGQIRIAPFNVRALGLDKLPLNSYDILKRTGVTTVTIKQAAKDRQSIPTFSFPWEKLKQLLFVPEVGKPYPNMYKGQLAPKDKIELGTELVIIQKR